MNTLTNQQIFDRIVRAMKKQGRKSQVKTLVPGGLCKYLSPNGDRCGVGCLFKTDDETNKRAAHLFGYADSLVIEGLGDEDDADWKLADFLDFDLQDGQLLLLTRLQAAHDTSSVNNFVKGFLDGAAEVAHDFSLDLKETTL